MALNGKVKGKPLIAKMKGTPGAGAFRSALHKVQDSMCQSGMDKNLSHCKRLDPGGRG